MSEKMYVDILHPLGMRSERNSPKINNKQLDSPSWQCSSTLVDFVWAFLSKEQCDNTGASPILSWPGSSFVPVSLTEIRIEGMTLLWCYWHNWQCDRKIGMSFNKMDSRNASNTFTVASRSGLLHLRTNLKEE